MNRDADQIVRQLNPLSPAETQQILSNSAKIHSGPSWLIGSLEADKAD